MATTQEHIPVQDIQQDLVILKDGSMAVVLETSAVNFGLLSENEQLAIISAFAGLLNSLSFMIQIVIRSKRLDISSYLQRLEQAKLKQSNPLLVQMIENYSIFIKNTIQENEVLDKQFFIVVPVSYLELGLGKGADAFKKALTILLPRRDHIIRQLSRIGLKANQLNTERLVKLFYDIYNEPDAPTTSVQAEEAPMEVAKEANPANAATVSLPAQPPASLPVQPPVPIPLPSTPATTPVPIAAAANVPIAKPVVDQPLNTANKPNQAFAQRSRPFVVEELPDEYVNP